jgi:hypothetical protein
MALVTCPDCGFSISDIAPTCSHCGGSNGSRVTAVSSAPPLNSYTAPVTADIRTPDVTLPFFEVGVVKFALMSIMTSGLYDLYWQREPTRPTLGVAPSTPAVQTRA